MAQLRCPVCGVQFAPEQSTAMPFCSRRCKLVDLGRWLDEGYGLPIEPEESPDPAVRREEGHDANRQRRQED